jgi:hypothetical protein
VCVRKAEEALIGCRTAELGGHVQACPEGHYQRRWMETRQKGHLLPIEAVMMVFRGKFLAYVNEAIEKDIVLLPLGITLQK